MLQVFAASHRAGCDHVALGWHGQPRWWLDEVDGHGAQGPEIGAKARTGRGHGAIGSYRQVSNNKPLFPLIFVSFLYIYF